MFGVDSVCGSTVAERIVFIVTSPNIILKRNQTDFVNLSIHYHTDFTDVTAFVSEVQVSRAVFVQMVQKRMSHFLLDSLEFNVLVRHLISVSPERNTFGVGRIYLFREYI